MSLTLTDYSRRRDYLSLTVIWGWNTKVSQTFNKSPSVYKIPFISSAICCWHIKALYELFPCGERLHLYFSFFLIETWGKWLARELAGDRPHTMQPYANIPTRHTPHFHCAFEDEMTKCIGAQWCQTVEDFIRCGTPQEIYSREFSRPDDVCLRDLDPFKCDLSRFGCAAFYDKMFSFCYIILYYHITYIYC